MQKNQQYFLKIFFKIFIFWAEPGPLIWAGPARIVFLYYLLYIIYYNVLIYVCICEYIYIKYIKKIYIKKKFFKNIVIFSAFFLSKWFNVGLYFYTVKIQNQCYKYPVFVKTSKIFRIKNVFAFKKKF